MNSLLASLLPRWVDLRTWKVMTIEDKYCNLQIWFYPDPKQSSSSSNEQLILVSRSSSKGLNVAEVWLFEGELKRKRRRTADVIVRIEKWCYHSVEINNIRLLSSCVKHGTKFYVRVQYLISVPIYIAIYIAIYCNILQYILQYILERLSSIALLRRI